MSTYQQIIEHLENRQLQRAIHLLQNQIADTHRGDYADQLSHLKTTYDFLLQYFVQNVIDPKRNEVLNKLINDLYKLSDEVNDCILGRESCLFEYAQIRDYQNHIATKYQHTIQIITDYQDQIIARNIYEQELNNLFRALWLNSFYSSDLVQLYTELLQQTKDNNAQSLAVSALTLSLWRQFSEEKLNILIDTCFQTDSACQQRALVGLCFVLAKYDKRITYLVSIKNKLQLFADRDDLIRKLEQIIIQIIRTSETEEISRKLESEILPEMLKANPKLKDKLKSDSFLSIDDLTEPNPEWSELLEESGIGKKLQEFSELQMSGADVYMSAFASLKHLPFFNEVHHWFLPFDKYNSDIAALFTDGGKDFLSTFVASNSLCNSDKYSFCLALLQMPTAQQNIMRGSMNADLEQLNEQLSDTDNQQKRDAQFSNQYIQDLYRFFKLHRNKSDFDDMFAYALAMHKNTFFEQLFTSETFENIANFYFSKKHYQQALQLFDKLDRASSSVELYQKKGYAYQQIGKLQDAMNAYLHADLLQPDNTWVLERMAACSRLLGDTEKALGLYKYIAQLKPNNKRNELNVGKCLIEKCSYQEALQVYYKLTMDYPDDVKIWRALAWCSFMLKKHEQAEIYLQKVLDKKTSAQDFLNAGHNAFCMQKRKEAIQYYKKSLSCSITVNAFWEDFDNDIKYLQEQGIQKEDIILLQECIQK